MPALPPEETPAEHLPEYSACAYGTANLSTKRALELRKRCTYEVGLQPLKLKLVPLKAVSP
jgi:hypothetical protein